MILKWFRKYRARYEQGLFDRGFDYAAGRLLRADEITIDDVIEELEMLADDPWDYACQFDKGIKAALRAWRLWVDHG